MKHVIIEGKLGQDTYSFKAKILSLNTDNLSLIVADEREALLTVYYYRQMPWSRIDRGSSGKWIVVVYKKSIP